MNNDLTQTLKRNADYYEEKIKKLEEEVCWQTKCCDMWRNKYLDLYNGKDVG